MKLALLKMVLAFLASLGIWLPSPFHVYLCNPGHGPLSAPSNCETVKVTPPR